MPTRHPPDAPSSIGQPLADYLRKLGLWAFQGFAGKVDRDSAEPGLLLQSPGGAVFSLGVDDQGRITSTPIILASGKPGTPSLTFGQVTLSGMRQVLNVGGTTSTSLVMMGLGFVLSSQVATRLWATINGTVTNDMNNGQTLIQLYTGIGASAPANGAPASGQPIGLPQAFEAATGGGFAPFSLTGTLTVTPLQPYWIDIAMRVTSGMGSISNITATAMGLP